MKRLFLITCFLLFFIPVKSFAVVPTVCVPSIIGHTTDRHCFRWKITCTGGYSAYDTNILGLMPRDFREEVMRSVWMVMDISASSTGGDYVLTWENAQQQTVFSQTFEDDVDTVGVSLNDDWNHYLPAHEFQYLTIDSNIGFGTVTIYIEGWIPEGR